jgi:hypothetical protein
MCERVLTLPAPRVQRKEFTDEELNRSPHWRQHYRRHRAAGFRNSISGYPSQARGPGLVYRLAVEVQRDLLKGTVAIGPGTKYSRGQPKR